MKFNEDILKKFGLESKEEIEPVNVMRYRPLLSVKF